MQATMICSIEQLGTGLRLDRGDEVYVTRATNLPDDYSIKWYASWEGKSQVLSLINFDWFQRLDAENPTTFLGFVSCVPLIQGKHSIFF